MVGAYGSIRMTVALRFDFRGSAAGLKLNP